MKYYQIFFIPILFISCGEQETTVPAEPIEYNEETFYEETGDSERKSPRTNYSASEEGIDFSIDYGSPRVKGREIWGDLVPYDKVWRAGADEVTAITFNTDVILAGNMIEMGTYGLFIIPRESGEWDVIINEEWSRKFHDVWGSNDYRQEKDVLRIKSAPKKVAQKTENLTYSYENGNLIFKWEFIRLEIPISAAVPA